MTTLSVKLLAVVCVAQIYLTSAQGSTENEDHMCEKTVRESVPSVVRETVTVFVRGTRRCGFLWLKRCTKYSVGYKEVTKTKYSIKSITKQVCCNGADVKENCTTEPKPVCNIAGKYGPDCKLTCECDVNRTSSDVCDTVTGYCYCLLGYGGPRCSQDLNGTLDGGYVVTDNVTELYPSKVFDAEVAGGGDIVNRAIIAVIVIVIIIAVVVAVFCIRKRKLRSRRKPASDGSTVSDDFVVSLRPNEETDHYITPEQMRDCHREQVTSSSDDTEKPYDYVEMRNVSVKRPDNGGSSGQHNLSNLSSTLSRKALERQVDSGRESMPYANIPSMESMNHDSETSHYYIGDPGPKLPLTPTYSLMRRQESGDSAFDDDGYCTSPTNTLQDPHLQYAVPQYVRDSTKQEERSPDLDNKTENVYDSLNDTVSPAVSSGPATEPDSPQYSNVANLTLPVGLYSHVPVSQNISADGYDHISHNSSTA